jgi:hypothetical protein
LQPDEFPMVFGPGVTFRMARIEMVPAGTWPFTALGWPRALAGEPVTRGIEEKLPWLRTFKGTFGGGFDPRWSRPSRSLSGIEFIRGL